MSENEIHDTERTGYESIKVRTLEDGSIEVRQDPFPPIVMSPSQAYVLSWLLKDYAYNRK